MGAAVSPRNVFHPAVIKYKLNISKIIAYPAVLSI